MKNFVTGVLLVATLAFVEAVRSPAIPFCEAWTNDQPPKCTRCAKFYGVNSQGKCTACAELSGCYACNTTEVCDKCRFSRRDGPDFNRQGTCSACAPNCISCAESGSGTCDKCSAGYFLDANKQCSNCPESCDKCQSGAINSISCLVCKPGYSKDAATSKCIRCSANCKSCTNSGVDKCDQCESGYKVDVNKQCTRLPCGANCEFCVNYECRECKSRGRPVGGSCECAQNCATCVKAGFGKCDVCKRGFKLSSETTCITAGSETI